MSGRGPSARFASSIWSWSSGSPSAPPISRPRTTACERALAEKEVLLREVHHRVKNNLQVVSSLMSLQARKAPAALKPYFQESLERVGAIGRVHEQLYRTEGSGSFDAAVLLRTICGDIAQIYGTDRDRITCRVEAAQAVPLPLDVATPLALIVSEVVSNAFKHAFGDGRHGEIVVMLEESSGEIRLEIHDDGTGFVAGDAAARPQSMGLRLIELLAGQIGGRTNWASDHGTRFTLILLRA